MGKILELNWCAFIIFLLGEIAAGVYLTINHGWSSVAIFSIPCLFILADVLDDLSFEYDCCDDICDFLASLFRSVGIIITLGLTLYLFVLFVYVDIHFITSTIDIVWGVAFIFVSLIWYLIVKEVSNKIRYVIIILQYVTEEIQYKREVEAQAKAKEEQRKQEARRAKIEEARIKQERLKQLEYRNQCKELVNDFWNEFFDSDEETTVLLLRLRFALENSSYKNWETEFYDAVVDKVNVSTRPPKSARSQQQNHATGDDLGSFKMYFNGIWLTPAQYQILNNDPRVTNLHDEDLLDFCHKLAEKIPEFADFKQMASGMSYYVSDEVQEACNFMDVKYEDLSEESLKKAFRRLSLQYHPDRNKSANAAEMFSRLQKSHEILQKALLRKAS